MTNAAPIASAPDTAHVGDRLPEQAHQPTTVQLFRYSAATWNSHRIHYDPAYAGQEGYPDIPVQSHLHGAFLAQLVTSWLRPFGGKLTRLSLSVRRLAVPGDELVCRGSVTAVREDDGARTLELALEEVRSADGVVCAPGTATVWIPHRGEARMGEGTT